MQEAPADFVQVIDILGRGRLRELFGLSAKHLYTMRLRRSVPPEYWFAIEEEAKRRALPGMDVASLHRMRLDLFCSKASVGIGRRLFPKNDKTNTI